jgi:hypothetical protein
MGVQAIRHSRVTYTLSAYFSSSYSLVVEPPGLHNQHIGQRVELHALLPAICQAVIAPHIHAFNRLRAGGIIQYMSSITFIKHHKCIAGSSPLTGLAYSRIIACCTLLSTPTLIRSS